MSVNTFPLSDQDAATINSTLTASQVQGSNGELLEVGTLIQTAQDDIVVLDEEVQSLGAIPVVGMKLRGLRTVAQINLLSPAGGDQYIVSNSGTLTSGSLAVTAGDLVEYSGSAWVLIADGVDGYVPAGTVVVVASSGTLYAPLASGDEAKTATFDGQSNTPTLSDAPVEGDLKRVVAGPDGSSVYVTEIWMFNGTAWAAVTTATLSDSTPGSVSATAGSAGVASSASRSDHVHKHDDLSATTTTMHAGLSVAYTTSDASKNKVPDAADDVQTAINGLDVAMPYDIANNLAAAADRVSNTTSKTAYATTVALAANALPAGELWTIDAWCYIAGVTGTPTITFTLQLDGVDAVTLASSSAVAAGDTFHLGWTLRSVAAGALGFAVVKYETQKVLAGTSTGVTGALPANAAFDTTATHTVSVTAQWSAASSSNQADLRCLCSSRRLAAAVT